MKRAALALLACLPVLALATPEAAIQDERALREECSAASQAGMRECLAKKAEDSQAALKQAEEGAANAVARWDEDAKYVKAAQAALAASGREFTKYRAAQCDYAASLSGGGAGNAHEIRRLACVAELNQRRAGQLRDSVAKLPPK